MRAVTGHPAGALRIFKEAQVGAFLDRPNRFLVRCKSHLFGMTGNPLDHEGFHDLLAWYRMDRLIASS